MSVRPVTRRQISKDLPGIAAAFANSDALTEAIKREVGSDVAVPLLPYQKRFLLDKARLKGAVKARQIGGSFMGTLDVVLSCLEGGGDWNTMSRTGRQAKKLLAKTANHVEAIDAWARGHKQPSIYTKITTEEIEFSNGAVIAALPCDPDTTVGDTCNWLLDEKALYPNSDKVFGTIKPSIMHGKRMIVVSTPRGRKNKFAKLFEMWKEFGDASGWSWHVIPIQQAIGEGLTLYDHMGNVLAFETFKKQEILDIGMEMWLQEYCCRFMDSILAFLSFETVQACSKSRFKPIMTPEELAALKIPLYAGVDIARHHHLTVIWIIGKINGIWQTVTVYPMFNTPFREQETVIRRYLQSGVIKRMGIDYMGNGMQLCENTQDDFPEIVQQVLFTNKSKMEMASRVRVWMESETLMIQPDDDIEEDFMSIERIVTEAGNTRLEAHRGNKTHGDYFWACCMAAAQAQEASTIPEIAMAAA